MTTYLVIALIVAVIAALSAMTARAVLRDGRGPQRPPRSRFQDPQLLPPARV